jgi:hypothetical protein
MNPDQDYVTVYRSADLSAEEEAAAVRDRLSGAGLAPVLLTDSAPDVPIGSIEVRVPAAEEAAAEQVIAAMRDEASAPGDASADLDLVTLYEGVGTTAEIEAISIRAVLDTVGIPSVLEGVRAYPNLPYLVKVPHSFVQQAQASLEEARQAGPAVAEEAERTTEPAG